jgi:Uma2 family endonuclease
MVSQGQRPYTPSEYLLLEAQADYKSEYYRGQIVAMAGASPNHNRITLNLATALSNAQQDHACEVFATDLRVWIAKRDIYVYPDLIVVCGTLELVEGRTDTITNPQVIMEVLSDSTERYDRGEKFRAYWSLDSLEEYVLLDQYRSRVEYFRRLSEKEWQLLVLTQAEDRLVLTALGVEMPLSQIYRNVSWDDEPS